jgi:hypothetical protein
MFDIRYKFIDNPENLHKVKVIKNVVRILSSYLKLPNEIFVEFRNMGPFAYGETKLDPKSKRKIILNDSLATKEIVFPFVHELIHLDQIENKKLDVYKNGDIYWQGKKYTYDYVKRCSYTEYTQLPWEQEVIKKQKKLLQILFEDDVKCL